MSAGCATCQQPLVLKFESFELEEDQIQESSSHSRTVSEEIFPDDVQLPCGDHFHWQCLLDAYNMTSCPACNKDITSQSSQGRQQILCSLKNEGGLQENLDILPILTEESYLKAYPEERKARAFLEFCRVGDVPAVLDMLQADDDSDADDGQDDETMDDEDEASVMQSKDVLRYQDALEEKQSALHIAVVNKHEDMAWLLLLLASGLGLEMFPPALLQQAQSLGIERDHAADGVDIRALRDEQDRSAEDLAGLMGAPWTGWLGKGLLTT